MSEAGPHPAEEILRWCAAAAPEPWYPRAYAKQSGVDSAALSQCLEDLWLDGLIEKAGGSAETGPGITLTQAGQRVLLDPEALQRLRAGQSVNPASPGAMVRQVFRTRPRPFVTQLIVLLNVCVFAGGYYAARRLGIDRDFLRGSPLTAPVAGILDKIGSLSPIELIDGQWWRLLTAGFVHIGFMHLLLNMVFLYMAGRYIEHMWGHVRYLLIYLVGLLGGSCLGIAHAPVLSAGASGAVCGLFGAEAVWFLFNRRYLPRALLRQARTGVIVNIILLVFISSFPSVSGWGHFGGAAAGALAALLLHLHRFGPPGWRWLALLGFVPLVWYGHYAIHHARATDENWHEAESKQFGARYYRTIRDRMDEARRVYADQARPLLDRHPTRRPVDALESVLSELVSQQRELRELAQRLANAGPYYSEEAIEARQISEEYVTAVADLFALAEDVLRRGDPQTGKDRETLREQEDKVEELRPVWQDLFTR